MLGKKSRRPHPDSGFTGFKTFIDGTRDREGVSTPLIEKFWRMWYAFQTRFHYMKREVDWALVAKFDLYRWWREGASARSFWWRQTKTNFKYFFFQSWNTFLGMWPKLPRKSRTIYYLQNTVEFQLQDYPKLFYQPMDWLRISESLDKGQNQFDFEGSYPDLKVGDQIRYVQVAEDEQTVLIGLYQIVRVNYDTDIMGDVVNNLLHGYVKRLHVLVVDADQIDALVKKTIPRKSAKEYLDLMNEIFPNGSDPDSVGRWINSDLGMADLAYEDFRNKVNEELKRIEKVPHA